ncbi:MAG: DUF3341 domain-containing protein [Elusimicrobiota bacterium]
MASELVAGVFMTEEAVVAAAAAARRAGHPIHDAFVPYPVHGLDHAMGLAPSALPTICFRFAAAGLLLALGFEYWSSLYDWPMNVGGKSFSASPALLPIAFELTVLFAALGSVATFLAMRGLTPQKTPTLARLGGLDDRFVLALRAEAGGPDAGALTRFLREHGASAVETEALR